MRPRLARVNTLVPVLLLAVAMTTGCQKYDVLIEKDQVAEQRWADLEAALQRRADLIPNLVNTVKAAAASEKEILSSVVEARAKATSIQLSGEDLQDPAKVAAFQQAQDQLTGALSRLMVVQEKYPELKSNENFRALQVQLEGTENRILRAREQYNAAVRDYNTELGKVGGSVVRRATGGTFKPREYFRASAASQAAPQVSF
ncbi:LemA family protein [Pyxidicoccus parkwayensis]|uniref:LemA family protein n=1 Tax=Pyxidicoccus parkwayensis TaxID=2813578 RepID=A0ABX7NN23_9BACT|nr:LemA family protein [Pyxidicoccus parkwaysis]QSQ18985.1 LemA family protein [Pyxidicoccus parkwaysis]